MDVGMKQKAEFSLLPTCHPHTSEQPLLTLPKPLALRMVVTGLWSTV